MGISTSFEEAIAQASEELKVLRDMIGGLIGDIVRPPSAAVVADAEPASSLEERCKTLPARQRKAHGLVAREISRIGDTIDHVAASFDTQEVPTRGDRLIGYLSKRIMRRRMARRGQRVDRSAQLLLALGRADRLAGIIQAQRDVVTEQRSQAEDVLARFYRRDVEPVALHAGGPSEARSADRFPEGAAIPLTTIVELLNTAAQDHTVFLHKLTFDVEHALELHSVLNDMGGVPDPAPQADAYPHFTRSVARYANGVLPGARLAAARQAAELAFADRFEVN